MCLLSWSSINPTFAQAKIERYQIKLVKNKVYIEAFINKKGPYNFLFDSGATGLGRLDVRLVKELGLEDAGDFRNSDGNTIKIEKMAKVDQMKVGKLTIKNINLMYRDYNLNPGPMVIDGVVGRDFFKDFLVSIDYPNQLLEISKNHLSINDPGVTSYDQAFYVTGKIGNIEGRFAFDSGSSQRFHFPEHIIKQVKNQPTGATSITKRANTNYNLTETILADTIWFGNKPFVNQKVNYSSLATWINVGTDFLKDHKITFDQKNKLIKID